MAAWKDFTVNITFVTPGLINLERIVTISLFKSSIMKGTIGFSV